MKHSQPRSSSSRGTDRRPGRRNNNNAHRKLSHTLSWVLRHAAVEELGLPMSVDGYVPVPRLLQHSHPRLQNLTVDQIHQVVAHNDKQRFKLVYKHRHEFVPIPGTTTDHATGDWDDAAVLCIRANQGHSIQGIATTALLQSIDAAQLAALPTIVHGTYQEPWRTIQTTGGLSCMGRNHIHFATGLLGTEGVISGMRASCEVYIYVDAVKCAADGIQFFQSDNGVLLTAGVNDQGILPLSYISHVTDRKGNLLLDQRNCTTTDNDNGGD